LVCDSALLSGYIYDNKRITEKIIHEVIKERDFNHIPQEEFQAETAFTAIKTFCCPDCNNYSGCEIKWLRGTKGEEQTCCQNCQDFPRCQESMRNIKLN
jgi:hypothetical protein